MSDVSVQELHDKMMQAHTAFYTSDPKGQLDAMVLAFTEDKQCYPIIVPMGDEQEKAASAAGLRELFKTLGVNIYAFCAEAWMAPYEKGGRPDVMPSQREDKREVVITVVVAKDGEKICSTCEINRDWETGGAVLSAPENMDGVFGGRFAELFGG